MASDDDKIDLDDIKQACRLLAAEGVIRDSGRRRNGQIVWELTEIGRAHGREIIDAADKPKQ